MKKVLMLVLVLTASLGASFAGPQIFVKGKGGIVIDGNKKTICPIRDPYVCAVITGIEFQNPNYLSIGDVISVQTIDGDEYRGTLVEISGDGSCEGCVSFEE